MLRFLIWLLAFQATVSFGDVNVGGQLKNAQMERQSADPTGSTARFYWNTTNAKARVYNGTAWQDFGSGGGASAAYTVSPTAVTVQGTAGFTPAAHVIDANDFPSNLTASQYSFYNLSSTVNDGNTTNAKNLTNATGAAGCNAGGTAAFTGTSALGTSNAALVFNGTANNLCSTSSFFNPGNGVSWAAGGWFAATAWNSGTHVLWSNWTSTSDRGWEIYINGGTNLVMTATNTASSEDLTIVGPTVSGFAANSWHHVASVYDYPNSRLKMYLDGRMVASGVLANTRSLSASSFRYGADTSTPGAIFAGKMQDLFFVNGGTALSDDDVRKLYARRFDHNLAIGAESQFWAADWKNSGSTIAYQMPQSYLVSKDNNRLWADFADVSAGNYVSLKMLNMQSSTTSVSQASYDSGYLSSTPSTTIAHGIGDLPASLVVYYETTTNKFTPLYGSNFCEMDTTNLYCDWTSLTVAAGSRVRIQAWAAGSMSAVPAASAAQSGVVNTTTQTFGGAKTFSGGIMGSTAGTTPCVGCIGERVVGTTAGAVAVNGVVGSGVQVASISLHAGNWLVYGHCPLSYGTASGITQAAVAITLTGGNNFVNVGDGDTGFNIMSMGASANPRAKVGPTYLQPTSTTTYYLNAGIYGASAGTAAWSSCNIYAILLP